MAPPTNMPKFFHFAVLFTTVTMVATSVVAAGLSKSQQVSTAAATAPSSAEALAFLHARCANTTYATACYNALLPFAGSFNGSQVKITSAATMVAFGQFRSLLKKIKGVQGAGGLGTGHYDDELLGECVHDLEMTIYDEPEAFASLRVLDNSGWISKEKRADALFNLKMYITDGGAAGCILDLTDPAPREPGADLSSVVAKKVMAWARDCKLYQQIASDLVQGITV